ncbi:hypothetical protein PaeBR_13635 [Paenibacillus sp. BR2-3]|uniref:hypothetical protein n=1 Tax=Paenibacillus sp. BR2-3 TaxID=3048494 RepID=UPI0039777CD7
MNRKRSILVASAIALAVTAGSGVVMIGNVSAAEVVKKVGDHLGGKGALRGKIANTELAALLGLTTDALKTALQSGKSLAVIAGEQGVDVQKVIDLQITALTAELDKKLAADKITQTEYDTQKATLTTRATNDVNTAFSGRAEKGFGGRGGFGHVDLFNNADLAALLGTTTEALKTALTSGKSLATLAGEKNVTVQAVTDLLTSQVKKELDQKLAAGTITQAQYDEHKAKFSTRVSEMVNNTFTGKEGDGGRGKHGNRGDRGSTGAAQTAPADAASGASAS